MLTYTKTFLFGNPILHVLANYILAVCYLYIHPAVHLNTSKALTSFSKKEKFVKSL